MNCPFIGNDTWFFIDLKKNINRLRFRSCFSIELGDEYRFIAISDIDLSLLQLDKNLQMMMDPVQHYSDSEHHQR